jgi:hypothetical protein
MLKKFLLFLIAIILFESCYKDDNVTTNKTIVEYPETIIEKTNVTGTILHLDGSLPDISEVVFNGQKAESVSPYFNFQAKEINRNFEVLNIEFNSGHILHYPLSNVANTINKHKIEIPKIENVISPFDNNYTYIFESGIELNLPINSFYKNSNQIDDPLFFIEELNGTSIPGNNQGISSNEELILLADSEIFYLGWNDYSIDLIFDQKVELNSTKNLFYLDPFKGEWSEHELNGAFKPGFYAFANSVLSNILTINVNHEIPSQDINLKIISESNVFSNSILSQSDQISIMVPKEEDFEIVVELDNIELSKSDHFSTNSDRIDLNIISEEYETLFVDVLPRNCDSEYDRYNILEITGTNYHEFYNLTEEPIEIIKPDLSTISCRLIHNDNGISTYPIIYNTEDEIYMGRQFLCSDVEDEYLFFLTEGHARVLTNISTTFDSPNFIVEGQNDTGDILFKLNFEATEIGELNKEEINVILDAPNLSSGYRINCGQSEEGCGFENFEIKVFKSINDQFVKAKFEGDFWMESFMDNSVGYRRLIGEFQIKLP